MVRKWYGHVKRRDEDYVDRNMLEMPLPGKRRYNIEEDIYLDVVKEDMQEKMKCLTDVYGETAVATPDGKSRKKKTVTKKY